MPSSHLRCGQCVLWSTHRCSQRYHRVPVRKESEIPIFDFSRPGEWNRWLEWIGDLKSHNNPVEHYKNEETPILKTDVACGDFVPFG